MRRYFWIIFIVVLVACETGKTAPMVAVVSTTSPTFTAIGSTPTAVPIPSVTTAHPETVTPTSSPPVSSAPDGLHMAYAVDGNLYFQDGGKPPVQLTDSGDDWRILFFSEDGEKIFFFRGAIHQVLYSIHVDGSHEQALVTNDLLLTFGAGYDESTSPCDLVLVPHTQLLIFRTCSHPAEFTTITHNDLFTVDVDTNQVKTLFAREQGGNFYVSPDGSMLAIDRHNSIDILSLDGTLIRRKIATYPRSEPIPVSSLVYWVSDSSELILALPIDIFYDTSQPPTYAVWRYSLDTGKGMQISLDPPPMSNEKTWVSSDGNWITYNNHYERAFYLGNLRKSRALSYELGLPYAWSPDSVHFIYGVSQPGGSDLYLASVNAPPLFVGNGEFLGWLDANRYIYFNKDTFFMGEIGKESMPILVGNTQHLYSYTNIIFNYQP